MPKLTNDFIEQQVVHPTSGQVIYRDEVLKGFALRVTSRAKTFIVERRVDGNTRRTTLGSCEVLSIKDARRVAAELLSERAAKAREASDGKSNESMTLSEALDLFLSTKNDSPGTKQNYTYAVRKCLVDWLDISILKITREMIEEKHKQLSCAPTRYNKGGPGRANAVMKTLDRLIRFVADHCDTQTRVLRPVRVLKCSGYWRENPAQQTIIPDHKLGAWCHAITKLENAVARDYLLFLLFTGMHMYDARRLRWSQVDFEGQRLNIPANLARFGRAYCIPISSFIVRLLRSRYHLRVNSEWVFQSAKDRRVHIADMPFLQKEVRKRFGESFVLQDLRRTFLSMAEKIDVPHYAIMALTNQSPKNDMSGRYLVLDIERVRFYSERISESFVRLLGLDKNDLGVGKRIEAEDATGYRQLRLFDDVTNQHENL